jgi:hypothetical protein
VTADRRDLDPAPREPWRPVSSEWARRQALEATAEAVRRAREKREAKYGEEA